MADAVMMLLLVIAWSVSIVLFWRRWKRFSLLGPRVQDVYQQPKNLESVEVVNRPVDSVIYASYPKHVVTAMQVLLYTGWAKNGLLLSVDNFATIKPNRLHTADADATTADATKLFCRVGVGGVNTIRN